MPSWWYYGDDVNKPLVGSTAKQTFIENGYTGRFMTSVKSHMRDLNLRSTMINGRTVSLEDIVAALLTKVKEKVESQYGSIHKLYAGRPVNLGVNTDQDNQVEQRIRTAYLRAGFPEPKFVFEPIAAAADYKQQLKRPELVLVADFGGGTLDYSLMLLEPPNSSKQDVVVGVGGEKIGGDDMTAAAFRLFWSDFGYGSEVLDFTRTKQTRIPTDIYHKLSRWTNLVRLEQYREKIRKDIAWGSTDPQGLKRLLALMSDDYYFDFLAEVEQLKVSLSKSTEAEFAYEHSPIAIRRRIERITYEVEARKHIDRARGVLEDVFEKAGVVKSEVDSVFMTGGSSQIPSFRTMIADAFGSRKIRDGDAFASVATGLAMTEEG
ncbi:MAG: Hsp70 family protein [Candidatus Magasanikbacteria bacterium]|nr:Hsp70 family protein [Candidatus Magasanikbacteria bacterium]